MCFTVFVPTLGSMNRLFGDFFKEFWRVILGGVRKYLRVFSGGFQGKNKGFFQEKSRKNGLITAHFTL